MTSPSRHSCLADLVRRRSVAALAAALIALQAFVGTGLAAGPTGGATPAEAEAAAGGPPTVHYEEAVAHADDAIDFAPGGRVTVGFRPRAGDRALVGGAAPRALPAGRLSGAAMREHGRPTTPAADPTAPPATDSAPLPQPSASADPTEPPSDPPPAPPTATAAPSDAPLDVPQVDPDELIDAVGTAADVAPAGPLLDTAAAVSPNGLRKEIFGFLPYWELADSDTVLDYSKLSTIAYFGVGTNGNGTLQKFNRDGSMTVGWSGWTSSRLTTVINDAHRNHTRVVLTVQSFAWSTSGADRQKLLLGSSANRANLAGQIAAAVRDRGADGVNLDFEPIVSGYGEEFTALVRSVRAELDAVAKGYQLTFDTTGYIGNYPIEAATAAGGADAIFVMGYDYRSASSDPVGSIAPIGGSRYDVTETVKAYTARVPASKIILGVPYYGRAWSTDSDDLNAGNISGTKYGASSTVVYDSAVPYLTKYGRRYDTREGVAWTVYRRENCTTTYGCVKPWRQLYVDDARALKKKYDLVNGYGLRGAGIWALGYDGTRSELWAAIRDKFVNDSTPPMAGVRLLPASQTGESFAVAWASRDDVGVASHDIEVSIDGGSWARWLSGTTATSATYVGARGHAFAFRVRARDHKGNLSSWTGLPVAGSAPTIGVGAFGRVVTDTLNARSAAGTGASIVTALATGDVVAFLEGPVQRDGYTWYRVQGPLTTWRDVDGARADLWVATGASDGTGEAFIRAAIPPNTTAVAAAASLAATNGATWHPISPIRLLDTRVGNGLSGRFADETVRTFQLAGRGSIPVDALAVTANLTVTGATGPGFVSIGATMSASPKTSTINFGKGQTIANGLTMRVASAGTAAAVYDGPSGTGVHLVLDVTGYLRPGTDGASWHPISPSRLLDTRTGNGLAGSFVAGRVRTLQVAGRAAIPDDALAVTGNLAATGATGSGYVSIAPTMNASPTTSTLNVPRGRTIANNLTLRLGAGGAVGAVFVGPTGSRVHLLFDVTGYFRSGTGGAEWYPISPVRLLDTRSGNGLSGRLADETVRTFQLTGRGSVPVNALAVTGNLTVTGSSGGGYASIGATMSASPTTSTINFAKGQTIANGLTMRVASGGTAAAVYDGPVGTGTHAIVDLTGFYR